MFSGVLLTSALHNILCKPLAAFLHNHCWNIWQRWKRNESCCNDYHQSSERILAEQGICNRLSYWAWHVLDSDWLCKLQMCNNVCKVISFLWKQDKVIRAMLEWEKMLLTSIFSFSSTGFSPFCRQMLLFESQSLPNYKILDWSKLKLFAHKKIYGTKTLKFVLGREVEHGGKRRKCIFSFSHNVFSKGFFHIGVMIQDCVLKR